MPSNFTATFQKPSTDVSVTPVAPLDTSSLISSAGDAIAGGIKAYRAAKQEKQDASVLGSGQAALNDIQQQQAEYYNQKHVIETAIAGGDAKQIEQYRQQLELLNQGKVNGTLTPVQATLRINDLLKQVTVNAPHLAKEFRAMASDAKGNVHAAVSEMFSDDPFVQQDKEDLKTAIHTGMTVQQVRDMNYRKARADDAALELEQLKRSSTKNADEVYLGLNKAVATTAALIPDQITGLVNSMMGRVDANGKPIPLNNATLETSIQGLQIQYRQQLNQSIAEMQAQTGMALTKDQRSALEDQYELAFKNATNIVKLAETPENVASYLKIQNDLAMQTGTHILNEKLANNPIALFSMGDKQAMQALFMADLQGEGAVTSFLSKKGNEKMTREEAVDAVIRRGGPEAMGAMRIKAGYSTVPAVLGTNNIFTGNAPSTGTKSEDAYATGVALTAYDHLTATQRAPLTDKVASGVAWEDMFKSKTLANDIRNSASASAVAIAKATNQTIPLLGVPGTPTEMVTDFTDPNNPVRLKNPGVKEGTYSPGATPNPVAAQMGDSVAGINKIYRQIRDNLGVGPATSWLRQLEVNGVKNVGDTVNPIKGTTGNPRGGAKATASANQSPVTDWVQEANAPQGPSGSVTPNTAKEVLGEVSRQAQAQGVDESLAQAVAFVESSGGLFLRNESSSARGPMHIIKDTFDSVNQTMFNGVLDWNNVKDQTKASVAYLKSLSDKYTDPRLVFASYFLGEPRVDAHLARGGIEDVLSMDVPGKNMSVIDYVNKAMQRASGG